METFSLVSPHNCWLPLTLCDATKLSLCRLRAHLFFFTRKPCVFGHMSELALVLSAVESPFLA